MAGLKLHMCVAASFGILIPGTLGGHPDDPKVRDTQPRYEGPGYLHDVPGPPSPGFDSQGVTLMSWLTIGDLDNASSGAMDCWGYTSPSGREYAIIGLTDSTVFVEVTNPGNAQFVGKISGPNNGWRDIKIYQHYAYSVTEASQGIQVIDMANIDSGSVTLVNTITTGGNASTHNVAINEDSGYLYRTGGGGNGLRVYDLADPTTPEYVGAWSDKYVHDAQIVSYVGGDFDGREIAFCCGGFNGGWDNPGLSIVDVTDKNNMFEIVHIEYPQNAYSHQGWLSPDRQYFYQNDELDEQTYGFGTNTRIFDVSDIENPVLVNTFSSGSSAIDHNLYVKDNFIFQANYRSGLRVFDATDPLNPTQVGYFDTYPGSDSANFNGLWSNYPYFDSGTIIGSDRERGLFVWTLSFVDFDYPDGRPAMIDPAGGTTMRVDVSSPADEPEPGTGLLHVDTGEGFVAYAMNDLGNNMYDAVFPPSDCGSVVNFYVSAEMVSGALHTDPPNAPNSWHSTTSASDITVGFADDFETSQGWVVSGDATTGQWERGTPAGGGDRGDPTSDGDGSGQCYLTQNEDGDSDVDGGTTILTSPLLDATIGDALISYWRWYDNSTGGSPEADIFEVEISNNGGGSWVDLETVGPAGVEVHGGWYHVSFRVADFLTPTDQMKVRFKASDLGDGSVVEAGIDGFEVTALVCGDDTALTDVTVVAGTLLSGGLQEILKSDDETLQTRSVRGFTAFEPNISEIVVGVETSVDPAGTIDVAIESRINNPTGTAKIRFHNWNTDGFDEVAQYTIGMTEDIFELLDTPAADYVRGDGRVEVSVRHVVIATLTVVGFDSFYDQVQVAVD